MPVDPRTIAEEALRLAEKAAPGPWEARTDDDGYLPDFWVVADDIAVADELTPDDAALIAHAGTHYATLARAYLEMVRNLPHAVGRCECPPAKGMRELWPADHRAAIERLRALGGG